ncbi:MAG TPA: serine hydrolase [Candidatus Blautia intestinavium]|nr:serine hydrolase [Candidatus Blautia intestinavium]
MKKKRRRRILLAVLAVAVVAGAGGGGFYFLKETVFKGPVMSYSIKNEFADYQVKDSEKRADSFAADLCVVSGDIPLDSVSLEEGQEGLLLNLDKQEVLYSKGAYERVYPASITKIMTALLAFQYGNMDDVVTITQDNVTLEEGSQVVGFQPGDQVTMDQLVHGLLVYSGNDAASAIATHIGGTEAEFVNMMNDYAAQLGCTGTHFTNPHGLQDENHYTTPYDIYLMLKEALNYPEFTEITQLSSYNVTYKNSDGADMSVSLTATDHYLTGEATAPKGITVLGGKTGTTSDAGNCLALLCQDAYGEPYISIIMGASTKEVLYQQMNSLLENVNAV